MTKTLENIQKKEESLAALMKKLLQAPLQSLDEGITKNIKYELTSIQKDIITQISNEIGASAADIEDIKKWVRGIKNTDVPKLQSEIEQYLSAQTQAQSEAAQNLAVSIHAYAVDHTKHLQSTSDALLAACHTSSQQHTQLANALQTWSEDLHQAHATLLERQTAQAQATLQATAQIRATLTQQITASDTAMAEQVTTAQAALLAELGSSQQTLAGMKATQTNSHTALMRILDEQHTTLSQQLTQAHSKLQRLTVVVGVMFSSTLIYVGYDIWHQLR